LPTLNVAGWWDQVPKNPRGIGERQLPMLREAIAQRFAFDERHHVIQESRDLARVVD
jgi:hypothetical protein